MRLASIDIGTNTVLLLIADIDERGVIRPIHHEQRFPRLGQDVDKNRLIRTSDFDRIGWVLNEYKNLAIQLRSERITACATSAVRDAANRKEFISFLRSTTGINVDILDGEEEARCSYRGALSGIDPPPARPVVLDIGGGSTELSYMPEGTSAHPGSTLKHLSFQLGSVRLTERCFNHNPPTNEEIDAARTLIRKEWESLSGPEGRNHTLVGVAGTVTTLACLDQGLLDFDVNRISGYRLCREHVEGWFGKLSRLATPEIETLSNSTAGRADILTAGALILVEFMCRFRFGEIIVSERGLRYGLVIREWEKQR